MCVVQSRLPGSKPKAVETHEKREKERLGLGEQGEHNGTTGEELDSQQLLGSSLLCGLLPATPVSQSPLIPSTRAVTFYSSPAKKNFARLKTQKPSDILLLRFLLVSFSTHTYTQKKIYF